LHDDVEVVAVELGEDGVVDLGVFSAVDVVGAVDRVQ
jgi:hypothetical protein